MIQTKLFRRYYAITAAVILLFIILGFFISNILLKYAMSREVLNFGSGPDIFFAKLIHDANPKDHPQGLKKILQLSGQSLPFELTILDQNGNDLLTKKTLPFPWEKISHPQGDFTYSPLHTESHLGPPDGPGQDGLIRLPGDQYLYITHKPNFGPHGGPPPALFFLTISSLLISVLLGVGFALYILFRSMREKMILVDKVIAELQKGNLKARLPSSRMDEMGLAMIRFNKMADEIEHLVERLRSIEKSRITLLQELTHDLRTPVASLKNLLVTIEKKSSINDQELREELLSLAKKEVDYFERLIEDLLMLAQIGEPRYQAEQDIVSILDILENEVQNLSLKEEDGKKIEIQAANLLKDQVSGDAHLLKRLFRNAIENAYSFAKSEIQITLSVDEKNILHISILDDGPGFSEQALTGFGERRVSRIIERKNGNRLSVGLGSVIMKTVTELHGGKISAKNRSGNIEGAEIEIQLPRVLHGARDTLK